MRNLNINKRPLIAYNFLGKEEIVDTNGYKTGSYIVSYSPEIEFMGHISGAKGTTQVEMFGNDIKYDKVINISVKLFKELGLDENSVFMIDGEPQYVDGNPLYDYKIEKIAETLNEVNIAISKVRRQ